MGWLDDTVALVTGAGSGLGRAIVERFLAEGAEVGVLEINPDKAKHLMDELGPAVAVTVGDATSLADNERAVRDTVQAFGRLDVFVGNAGLWDFSRSLESLPDDAISEAFDEIFHLNVLGYMLGAKAALICVGLARLARQTDLGAPRQSTESWRSSRPCGARSRPRTTRATMCCWRRGRTR